MLSKAASDIRPALIHEVESISELVFQSELTQPLRERSSNTSAHWRGWGSDRNC